MLTACSHTEICYRESYAVTDVSNVRKHLIFWVLRLVCVSCAAITAQNFCSHPEKRTLYLIIVETTECKWIGSVRWKISEVWNISHKTTPFFCRCIFNDISWFVFYLFGWKWQTEEPALPCPWPDVALPSIFIVDPSDTVMSWAKGKVKIPSRNLSHGFTRQCLPLRDTAIR